MLLAGLISFQTRAQEKWYHNPIPPLSGGSGFIAGATAVTACLVFLKSPKRDTTYTQQIHFFQDNGYYNGYNSPFTSVFLNNTGALFRVRKWMSLGLVLHAYHFRDSINNTWGLGGKPFARWYLLQKPKWKLFFEYGAGIVWSLDEFPDGGTHFNFTPTYGLGTEWRFDDRFNLQFGLRHLHISNAYLFGEDRNPSHDSNGFFIGFKYKLSNKS